MSSDDVKLSLIARHDEGNTVRVAEVCDNTALAVVADDRYGASSPIVASL